MTVHRSRRLVLAILFASAFVLPVAGAAGAGQDPGPLNIPADSPLLCTVERVGTQIVRCDDLSGNGVSAPLYLDER
jgi:hypothetical protein